MNKVFNVNVGGYPFTIDEDAYEHLSNYLKTIHHHFRDSEGYEEITGDIEARLAELFQESLGNRPILTIKDVENAIAIMGTPEDFGAEPVEEGSQDESQTKRKSRYQTGKRLFRNPEDEVLGGVCSGIAAYFGINDPLWIRLLFVVISISGGLGIPTYLILWAILPKAESAADRLAMRGEPINASNIGKIIEEEMEHFSEKMTEWGDEINTKWGSGSKKKPTREQATQNQPFPEEWPG
jgi:phage shock protein PspC (stress-responsive transcriptional regulator)